MNTDERIICLAKLSPGKKAVIRSHEPSDFQLALMEMGCIPGEPVLVQMIAPLGDPLAIQVAGYCLSIRKKDARRILVSEVGETEPLPA